MIVFSMVLHNEVELVEKAKTDDGAFSQLYEHYLPLIFGYVHKRVGNQDDAEEITSQVFLKVVEHLKRFHGTTFKAWIYRIATNTIIDYYRSFKPVDDIEELHEVLPEHSPNPHEALTKEQDRSHCLKVLAKLPEKSQKILHLKYFADFETEEIAQALETSENNVGVMLHRAISQFEQMYHKLKDYA